MEQIYVEVLAKHSREGEVEPLFILWEDGRRFCIDRVLDKRRRASLKVGGIGTRYTCVISGKKRYLFYEDDKWFVEGK